MDSVQFQIGIENILKFGIEEFGNGIAKCLVI